MDEEMADLDANATWGLVTLLKDKKAIRCKWVYKVKHNADGSMNRYKARLVAKGYAQMYGIDYEETYSLVAKMTTIRAIITMAAVKGWSLHQMDVKNVFLHGDLQEEMYMEQPPGYVDQCRNPNLAKCGGEAQHLEKLGIWSPSGLPHVQSSTAGPKTPRIGVFLMSLERS
jgi:hypothetical protein